MVSFRRRAATTVTELDCASKIFRMHPSRQTSQDSFVTQRCTSRYVRCWSLATMLVWVLICWSQHTTSFELSMMVASTRPPYTEARRLGSRHGAKSSGWGMISPPPPTTILPDTNQLSSTLISNLAEVALKARLGDQSTVQVDVAANPTDLIFQGKVGPVSVVGRSWKSKLGLTCRAIEATVDSCLLDVGKILSQRKLRLITPGM